MYFWVHLNMTRGPLELLPPPVRLVEARRDVKMILLPQRRSEAMFDSMVPDHLVTDDMVVRFLDLNPPIASVIAEFQEVINEIERAYVVGMFFSAVSASCVTIERLLNIARIELHPYHQKIKKLWGKGPSNSWDENVEALQQWKYLDELFSTELKGLYREVRCRYLHSWENTDYSADALRSAQAAYRLLRIFLGFPEDLFRFTNGIECLNTEDPRFLVFYRPHIHAEPQKLRALPF